MKRNLTTRATFGGTAKMLRGLMADNAGGQGNSEIDELRAVNADLLAALHQLDTWLHSGITVDGKAPEIAQQWTRAAIRRATGAA